MANNPFETSWARGFSWRTLPSLGRNGGTGKESTKIFSPSTSYTAPTSPPSEPPPPSATVPTDFRKIIETYNLATLEDIPTVIDDFLDLKNIPWVDVRNHGYIGDKIVDDAPAINSAINELRVIQAGIKDDQYKYTDCPSRGVVWFPPNTKARIKSPILMESDHSSTSARIFADAITLYGENVEIVADKNFQGVVRYTSSTATETLNAMLIVGVRSYGKFSGHLQGYNNIIGLTFNGEEVASLDLTAIRMDVVYHSLIQNCIFEKLHKAIDGRVIALPQVKNCRAVYVNSFYCAINDSEALGWNSGNGLDSGGPVMSDINVHFSKNLTSATTYTTLGKIHLVNVGEELISNVKIMGGGGRGIFKEYSAASKQHEKWGNWNNIEIAGMYYYAVYLKKFQQTNFSNCLFVWNQEQSHDATARPIILLEDVKRINMSNFTIDQECSPDDYNCAQLLTVQGGGCHFSNFKAFGLPEADDTYACVRIENGNAGYDGDWNVLTNFEAANLYYTSGNKFKYGVREVAGCDENIIANGIIKNFGTSATLTVGGSTVVDNII